MKKSKDADLVKNHPSVVDSVEIFDLDNVEFAVHLVDPVMGKDDKKKPSEQKTHVQYRAPCQCTSKQF